MDNQDKKKIWELSVGKVNNSLDPIEEAYFANIQSAEEISSTLKLVQKIQQKVYKALFSRQIEKDLQWERIHSSINKKASVRRLYFAFSKYAAVFIIALLLGVLISKTFIQRQNYQANNIVEVEWGYMNKLTLSDGTKVWLNAGTTFEYPSTFNLTERQVYLNGEAQFKVTHNKKAPFEVKTTSGTVKVFGTIFNVSSYADDPDMVVTLVEGKVGVEDVNGKLLGTLKPSEQIIINKKTGNAHISQVETKFYSSWIEGKIIFENTSLSELSKILQRWYNVDITLQGDDTKDIEISGTLLKEKPLDLFLKVLDRLYGVKSELKVNNNGKDKLLMYKK